MIIDPSGFLYYSVFGGGVYRSLSTTTSVEKYSDNAPRSFALEQNYPNPFNSTTVIYYQLVDRSRVRLGVYDILGQEIAVLVNKELSAGRHSVRWDAGISSGVYFYRMEALSEHRAGRYAETKKMVLLR